jgi:outer membrane protein TolC
MTTIQFSSAALCVLLGQAMVHAQRDPQPAGPQGGLTLADLQHAAAEADPRFRQLQLQQAQTDLRLANLAAEHRPSVEAQAQGQYQSDVPTPPPFLPGGQPFFQPPKGTVDMFVRVDQRILDPTIGARQAVERAQLAEGQARVRTALFALRQEVNDAFFAAALFEARLQALAATIAELEARLAETNVRVREGAAVPADAAAIEATLLERRQDDDQLRANRVAALKRLSDLTGRTIAADDQLALPDPGLMAESAAQSSEAPAPRVRPEYEQFARTEDRLARQQDAATAQERPQFSAFARGGYGRPGLNIIGDTFEAYGLAGLQVRWKAWTWGAAGRERQALELQQQIVAADEAAFTRAVARSTDSDRETIDHLTRAVALDERIVALREQVARTAEVRLREGVLTAAEYVERSTDLLTARFARAGHRVELAQAGARLLTTLGLEVR